MELFTVVAGFFSSWILKRRGGNLIRDWRRENTLREHLRYQAELEQKRMENETLTLVFAQEEARRQADLERRRIEAAQLQHQQQTRTEIAKALIEHGQASPMESAQFLLSLTGQVEERRPKHLLETDDDE